MNARTCRICDAPSVDGRWVNLDDPRSWPTGSVAHGPCVEAWFASDREAVASLRAAACAAGHHRYPGAWKVDPAIADGYAVLWECARGCGYVRRHPGYGFNSVLAAVTS